LWEVIIKDKTNEARIAERKEKTTKKREKGKF